MARTKGSLTKMNLTEMNLGINKYKINPQNDGKNALKNPQNDGKENKWND